MSSNLATLATEIDHEIELGDQHGLKALEHYRNAGQRLLAAKADVPHGGWSDWLAANVKRASERSAQRYMRLAKHWHELAANTPSVADMSLAAAEAALAKPKAELEDDIVVHPDDQPADDNIPADAVALLRRLHEDKPWTHEGDQQYPETALPDMFQPAREVRDVPVDAVIYEAGIDPRSRRKSALIAWYAKILDMMPPVATFDVGGDLVLADGWYRLEAAKLNGWSTIPVRIYDGGIRDAQLYYMSANARHGMSRSEADLENMLADARREVVNLDARERRRRLEARYGS